MSRRVRQPNWYWDSEFPRGYPWNFPVEGKLQFPCLSRVAPNCLPDHLVSFDNRGSAKSPTNTALHFYKDDTKLHGFLADPLSYVSRFVDFGGIITPDFTITKEMPDWAAKRRIWASRAIGAIYQTRGFTVIPNVRWNSSADYEMAIAGLPKDSAVAVSNYGLMQNPDAAAEFLCGLRYVTNELQPHTVMLYGSKMKEVRNLLPAQTTLIHFQANNHLRPQKAWTSVPELNSNPGLF